MSENPTAVSGLLVPDMGQPIRPKLLLVDDQAVNIQVLHQAFSADHQLIVARSGARALEICAAQQPDLVLLDVVMPDIDGYEVCKRLKADPATCDIPVIFVTSHTDEAQEAHGLDVGAVDFISKPFSTKIVRARVNTHITLKRQSDQLRSWVYVDRLTGVYNRRFFDDRLKSEWGRAARNRTPLSLLMLDVDYFKRYNDHYGHQAGDMCLRCVATAIQEKLQRPGDHVARYGGEEFACILPDTDLAAATHVAQAIRANVFAARMPHLASDLAPVVTVSVSVCTKLAVQAGTAHDLLCQADVQLFAAKRGGRNAVCAAVLTPSAGL